MAKSRRLVQRKLEAIVGSDAVLVRLRLFMTSVPHIFSLDCLNLLVLEDIVAVKWQRHHLVSGYLS